MSVIAPLLLAAVALLAPPTWASEPPPTLTAALQGKAAVGQARLRVWGFQVYDATLYAGAGFDAQRYEAQRFGLELAYLRRFEGADIAQRSIDEMRAQAPIDDATAARWLAAMKGLFPDVAPGDRITGVHAPGVGARFYLNGRWLGAVDDDAFSRRFFAIWLSPRTSQPAMREALLQTLPAAPRTP
ncbi:MAG: chalcone isomerase family protein [Hydrogenophaga sp.]|nr:chalcone isomerase family protein [Hydrogenophaga sp.]